MWFQFRKKNISKLETKCSISINIPSNLRAGIECATNNRKAIYTNYVKLMSSLHKVHVRNGEDCVEEVEETLLRASAGLSSLTDKVIMEYLQYLH